ncbi:hypothetical protein HYW84_00035 [Candidatus Peregrinibacteria bacterium]|nr:hypothetical protein [Candidatus Peregrinibacteria bacterium]
MTKRFINPSETLITDEQKNLLQAFGLDLPPDTLRITACGKIGEKCRELMLIHPIGTVLEFPNIQGKDGPLQATVTNYYVEFVLGSWMVSLQLHNDTLGRKLSEKELACLVGARMIDKNPVIAEKADIKNALRERIWSLTKGFLSGTVMKSKVFDWPNDIVKQKILKRVMKGIPKGADISDELLMELIDKVCREELL